MAAAAAAAALGVMATPKKISHVIFDMDGLLLGTEKIYTTAHGNVLKPYGKEFNWSIKSKMMGRKAFDAAQTCIKESGLEGELTPEDFITESENMLVKMFPDVDTMPGAERLIKHLHNHSIPIALATSSHKKYYELKITKHRDLFALMHHVVLGDDPEVKQGKPSPDIFLVAARRFEPPPRAENVLVFEDAPFGVTAAKSAGMSVVMVPDPGLDVNLCKEADQVINSLTEFNPDFWGLPPFEDNSGY